MALFGNLKQKHNHKKCQKVWTKVRNMVKYQDSCIITLSKLTGYEELFKKMEDSHLKYTINDTGEGGIYITIEKTEAFTIGQLLF